MGQESWIREFMDTAGGLNWADDTQRDTRQLYRHFHDNNNGGALCAALERPACVSMENSGRTLHLG